MTANSERSRYYDRHGQPITLHQWAELFEDRNYQIIEQTIVNDRWLVSTIWLGLDHSWSHDVPLIFETMVFDENAEGLQKRHDLEVERYSSEAAARSGHAAMVTHVAEDYQ